MTMKQTFYISTILFFLTVCNQNVTTTNHAELDSVTTEVKSDRLRAETNTKRKIVSDSSIFPYDSLFADLNLDLIAIPQKQYQSYMSKSTRSCTIDSGQFIQGSGIFVRHDCNETCETYLCEKATNRKMLLPSDYDAGVLSMQLSPSCSRLMVSSSYDGPDFVKYYDHRAEIFIFTVSIDNGLHGIKPALKFYTKDWSIDDIIWVNDKTIALKIYEEGRQGDGSSNSYKYYKADLNK